MIRHSCIAPCTDSLPRSVYTIRTVYHCLSLYALTDSHCAMITGYIYTYLRACIYVRVFACSLQLWASSRPDLSLKHDVLLVDEAQDLSPAVASVVLAQTRMPVILVGDPHQAIYGFLGATNALSVTNIVEMASKRRPAGSGGAITSTAAASLSAANLTSASLSVAGIRPLSQATAAATAMLDDNDDEVIIVEPAAAADACATSSAAAPSTTACAASTSGTDVTVTSAISASAEANNSGAPSIAAEEEVEIEAPLLRQGSATATASARGSDVRELQHQSAASAAPRPQLQLNVRTLRLTRSFRFGSEIAAAASALLHRLKGETEPLLGNESAPLPPLGNAWEVEVGGRAPSSVIMQLQPHALAMKQGQQQQSYSGSFSSLSSSNTASAASAASSDSDYASPSPDMKWPVGHPLRRWLVTPSSSTVVASSSSSAWRGCRDPLVTTNSASTQLQLPDVTTNSARLFLDVAMPPSAGVASATATIDAVPQSIDTADATTVATMLPQPPPPQSRILSTLNSGSGGGVLPLRKQLGTVRHRPVGRTPATSTSPSFAMTYESCLPPNTASTSTGSAVSLKRPFSSLNRSSILSNRRAASSSSATSQLTQPLPVSLPVSSEVRSAPAFANITSSTASLLPSFSSSSSTASSPSIFNGGEAAAAAVTASMTTGAAFSRKIGSSSLSQSAIAASTSSLTETRGSETAASLVSVTPVPTTAPQRDTHLDAATTSVAYLARTNAEVFMMAARLCSTRAAAASASAATSRTHQQRPVLRTKSSASGERNFNMSGGDDRTPRPRIAWVGGASAYGFDVLQDLCDLALLDSSSEYASSTSTSSRGVAGRGTTSSPPTTSTWIRSLGSLAAVEEYAARTRDVDLSSKLRILTALGPDAVDRLIRVTFKLHTVDKTGDADVIVSTVHRSKVRVVLFPYLQFIGVR